MAYYLVRARPKSDGLKELENLLKQDAFLHLRPFGKALTTSLRNARIGKDGAVVWEEEDYCSPPLAHERAAVLDKYFEDLHVEPVERGNGWKRIRGLPSLFPEVAGPSASQHPAKPPGLSQSDCGARLARLTLVDC